MLTNADMTFPDIADSKGAKHPLTQERHGTYMVSQDRTLRENAFKTLHSKFGDFRNTLSGTLNATLRSAAYFAKSRKYGSTLEAALAPDAIPMEVYHGLIDTVGENLHLLHRYASLKKRALKLDSLHMYDMYVPLAPEPLRDIPYEDACRMVTRALETLGPEYVTRLNEGFSSRWIDVRENRGKQGGAYSWGSYGVHPYVLLNYNGTFRDVFTIAHEMGHALHKAYTDRRQPFVYAGHSIFTAEVASTTNEILLHRSLRIHSESPKEKLYFAQVLLEQIRTTFFRQTLFAEFELAVHGLVAEGGAPTADTFCTLWRELNEKYYGPELVIDRELEYEWSRIPHFYSPFYVYQYATGYAAATALAEDIVKEGDPAVERYIGFLESGKSDYPVQLLKRAGVDMTSPDPVEAVASLFGSTMEELEKMLAESEG
jgi:oligoendopeptidase F